MIIWIDAQLSPALAPWITEKFGVKAYSARWLGYRDATDKEIFDAARKADATVMTKDKDFIQFLDQMGPPPRIIWVTLGNTSNLHMEKVLDQLLPQAMELLESDEPIVEIGDPQRRGREG